MGDPMRQKMLSAVAAAFLLAPPAQGATLHGGHSAHGGRGFDFGSWSFCSFGGGGLSCWKIGGWGDHSGPRFGIGFHPGFYNPPRRDEHCEDDPDDQQPPVVPLPAGLPLLLSGLGAVALLRRRGLKAR